MPTLLEATKFPPAVLRKLFGLVPALVSIDGGKTRDGLPVDDWAILEIDNEIEICKSVGGQLRVDFVAGNPKTNKKKMPPVRRRTKSTKEL